MMTNNNNSLINTISLNCAGSGFDVRDFHSVVMDHMGTIDFLERGVKAYIEENKK